MKPTFKQLRQHLNHPQTKELLNLYNTLYPYDKRALHRIWQRNYHELINLLDDLDYNGSLSYTALTKFIRSFDEEEKEQQKKDDDNLFNKLSVMKKDERQKQNQKELYKQKLISEANKLMYKAIKIDFDPQKMRMALDLGSTFSGRDDQDQPALIVAIKTNNEKIIEIFLPMGDIYAVDNNGWSPLMHATKLGNKHVVEYLLEKLPVEAVEWKNFDGKTAVDIAKENNQTEILDMLEQYFENHKENGARQ